MKNNVIDSSGWIEYFTDSKNANFFARSIECAKQLIVPGISISEVFKHVMRHRSEKEAFECVECMLQGNVIELNLDISLNAAKLGMMHRLPLADSIIYATGLAYEAIIWTQDADFKGLPNVEYITKN